ncbi:MAG: biotin/lipoate A/B protein ligase family protein [Candidatus Aminicenantes bacterium]|jgi:lipoate-protein ligase A
MNEWDLIIDETPLDGSWNMAVDEFLLQSLTDEPQTILRFYSWKNPTVSLGYSQKAPEVVDVEFCKKRGIDIVRRMTGGKLVLHHKEVTYSLASSDTDVFTATLNDSYRLISEALMAGLKKMGLTPSLASPAPQKYVRGNLPCFSYPSRNEVEFQGRKIIGSAQKRVDTKFLQHGSIPLEEDDELLTSISLLKGASEKVRMISLTQALGSKIKFNWAVEGFAQGVAEYFCIRLKKRTLSKNENETVRQIQKDKYGSPAWTFGSGP